MPQNKVIQMTTLQNKAMVLSIQLIRLSILLFGVDVRILFHLHPMNVPTKEHLMLM